MDDDWALYVGTDLIRSGLTEEQATQLVAANADEGIPGVYALGPGGSRIG